MPTLFILCQLSSLDSMLLISTVTYPVSSPQQLFLVTRTRQHGQYVKYPPIPQSISRDGRHEVYGCDSKEEVSNLRKIEKKTVDWSKIISGTREKWEGSS